MAEKEKNEWAEKLAYAPKNGYERLSEMCIRDRRRAL